MKCEGGSVGCCPINPIKEKINPITPHNFSKRLVVLLIIPIIPIYFGWILKNYKFLPPAHLYPTQGGTFSYDGIEPLENPKYPLCDPERVMKWVVFSLKRHQHK